MANNRIFYAVQGIVMGSMGGNSVNTSSPYKSTTALNPVKGLQSIGINTSFNLEQAFELGQISIYENIEEIPDIEVTMEKVFDGFPLLYHLATIKDATGNTTTDKTLVGRSTGRSDFRMGVWQDTVNQVGDVNPESEVYCSGLYPSSLTYTLPVDGNCTESLTLVGNNKQWFGATAGKIQNASMGFGTESPLAAVGVLRRENVEFLESVLPTSMNGILLTNSGNNITGTTAANPLAGSGGAPIQHIQTITISTDLGREPINELGRRAPYHRFATFPIEVTCDIETISTSGDFVNALEESDNLSNDNIIIRLQDSTTFDLGIKNKLSSVSYGGGDAGGGNVAVTYSFSNFNDLTVTQQNDPAAITNP